MKLPHVEEKIASNGTTTNLQEKAKKYVKNGLQSLDFYFFAEDKFELVKTSKESQLRAINEWEKAKNKSIQIGLEYNANGRGKRLLG